MKLIYISDFFLEDLPYCGGAEYNDKELIKILIKQKFNVDQIKSSALNLQYLIENKNNFFIISNFLMVSSQCLEFITNNCKYIIYEHDHKYLKSRNPILYKNFKAPKEQIINYLFYKNSISIFCQSSFHARILKTNLQLKNVYNISGNLWSQEDLNYIEKITNLSEKRDMCSIMESSIWNKNTEGSVEFCKKRNMKYELISDKNYHNFLKKISMNKKFIFLPRSPETLSRVCVEAKMLGCSLIVNNLIGAKYEEWFKEDSKYLISYMRTINSKILKEVERCIESAK